MKSMSSRLKGSLGTFQYNVGRVLTLLTPGHSKQLHQCQHVDPLPSRLGTKSRLRKLVRWSPGHTDTLYHDSDHPGDPRREMEERDRVIPDNRCHSYTGFGVWSENQTFLTHMNRPCYPDFSPGGSCRDRVS